MTFVLLIRRRSSKLVAKVTFQAFNAADWRSLFDFACSFDVDVLDFWCLFTTSWISFLSLALLFCWALLSFYVFRRCGGLLFVYSDYQLLKHPFYGRLLLIRLQFYIDFPSLLFFFFGHQVMIKRLLFCLKVSEVHKHLQAYLWWLTPAYLVLVQEVT